MPFINMYLIHILESDYFIKSKIANVDFLLPSRAGPWGLPTACSLACPPSGQGTADMVAGSAVSPASAPSFPGSRLDQSVDTHSYPVCLSGAGLRRKSGPLLCRSGSAGSGGRPSTSTATPLAPAAPLPGAGGGAFSHPQPLWTGSLALRESPEAGWEPARPGPQDRSWVNSGWGVQPRHRRREPGLPLSGLRSEVRDSGKTL